MAENTHDSSFTYENVIEAAEHLKSALQTFRPRIGIICGSGLGALIDMLDHRDLPIISYHELPHFAHMKSTVEGHSGKLHFGYVHGVEVMISEGRIHPYEGFSYQECCLPIYLMRKLGVTHVILTNAAGSMNASIKVGSFVLIKDHVDISALCGRNPLYGVRDPRFWSNEFGPGSRFVAVANCYDEQLRKTAKEVATQILQWTSEDITEGLYCRDCGPYYETWAEISMIRRCVKADVVSMSTTYEAVMAHQCTMKVLGITSVSDNIDSIESLTHEQVLQANVRSAGRLATLLSKLIETLAAQGALNKSEA